MRICRCVSLCLFFVYVLVEQCLFLISIYYVFVISSKEYENTNDDTFGIERYIMFKRFSPFGVPKEGSFQNFQQVLH